MRCRNFKAQRLTLYIKLDFHLSPRPPISDFSTSQCIRTHLRVGFELFTASDILLNTCWPRSVAFQKYDADLGRFCDLISHALPTLHSPQHDYYDSKTVWKKSRGSNRRRWEMEAFPLLPRVTWHRTTPTPSTHATPSEVSTTDWERHLCAFSDHSPAGIVSNSVTSRLAPATTRQDQPYIPLHTRVCIRLTLFYSRRRFNQMDLFVILSNLEFGLHERYSSESLVSSGFYYGRNRRRVLALGWCRLRGEISTGRDSSRPTLRMDTDQNANPRHETFMSAPVSQNALGATLIIGF